MTIKLNCKYYNKLNTSHTAIKIYLSLSQISLRNALAHFVPLLVDCLCFSTRVLECGKPLTVKYNSIILSRSVW